jgi:glycosyltransferase involved in cell wall biosynthesis
MKKMKILLIGNGLFYHIGAFFRQALEELGYEYYFVDEERFLAPLRHSLIHKIAYRLLGKRPLTYWALNREVLNVAQQFRPQIVLIIKGAYIRPETLIFIKKKINAILVNYATDDPFNPINSTRDLINSIAFYDLYACTKRAIMDDVKRAGCPNVVYVPFGYMPSLHFPEKPKIAEEKIRFSSDVVFIGGCDKDRAVIFEALIHALPDVQLALYGGYWNRFPQFRPYYRGFALGRDFRLALGGAKIALNLVRKANRDGHVMRTFEIPACGAFMLAERTEEHLEFFEEDKEAVYFSSIDELVDKLRYYLHHDNKRVQIAERGYKRVTLNKHTYKDRLQQILNLLQ